MIYVKLTDAGHVHGVQTAAVRLEGWLAVTPFDVSFIGPLPSLPPDRIWWPGDLSLAELDKFTAAGGVLVPRPVSPRPELVPEGVLIPPCPVGTSIELIDVSGDEIALEMTTVEDGFSEVIALPDPGEYEITIEAPDPALPVVVRFQIR